MNSSSQGAPDAPRHPSVAALARRFFLLAGGFLLIYVVTAYVVVPLIWRADTQHHPDLSGTPTITHTASGIPGDP